MASTKKVALITGGTKGVGAATASLLHSQGWAVAITYSSDAGAADKLVQKLGADSALAVKADAANVVDIDRVLESVMETFGRLDAVVASAGCNPLNDPDEVTEDYFDWAMGLNAKGPFFLVQKAARHLKDGQGRVVFISTSQTIQTTVMPEFTLYLATKGAIEQMTRGFAKALGKRRITVNSVGPGPTDTDMLREGRTEENLKFMAGLNPQNRLGKPEDIAAMIAFLCSEQAQWINGQRIWANGGSA